MTSKEPYTRPLSIPAYTEILQLFLNIILWHYTVPHPLTQTSEGALLAWAVLNPPQQLLAQFEELLAPDIVQWWLSQ